MVSPLDPEFFLGIDEYADELLNNKSSGKYSPAWVAAQLDDAVGQAMAQLGRARSKIRDNHSAEFRRLAVDITIQAGLGKFYAAKFRSGMLFAIYLRTGDSDALKKAITANRAARDAWADLANTAKGVYRDDITFGPEYFQRGHWLDRLPAMDADIADMENLVAQPSDRASTQVKIQQRIIDHAVRAVSAKPQAQEHHQLAGVHTPQPSFRRGQPLAIVARVPQSGISGIQLRYRHVNQGETWQAIEMQQTDEGYHAVIAAEYTDSQFPLQYHFQIRSDKNDVWLYPGLHPGWPCQPYFIVRQA
jgi:hypothetical protein